MSRQVGVLASEQTSERFRDEEVVTVSKRKQCVAAEADDGSASIVFLCGNAYVMMVAKCLLAAVALCFEVSPVVEYICCASDFSSSLR